MRGERTAHEQYGMIASAIRYITAQAPGQPSLKEVAEHVGLSEFHLQRLFSEWAGVSPKEFVQALTLERAKAALAEGASLLHASAAMDLSGPSRLHDLFITTEAVTPGEFRNGGAGVEVRWTMGDTPFGSALFAETDRGLGRIAFCDDAVLGKVEVERSWPNASLRYDPGALQPTVDEVAGRMAGRQPTRTIGVLFRGSPFRMKVWRALLEIPYGRLASYGSVACVAGSGPAVRAVASSIAQNPLAFLVPCHRVIRETGVLGQYHWGGERKALMIARELVR